MAKYLFYLSPTSQLVLAFTIFIFSSSLQPCLLFFSKATIYCGFLPLPNCPSLYLLSFTTCFLFSSFPLFPLLLLLPPPLLHCMLFFSLAITSLSLIFLDIIYKTYITDFSPLVNMLARSCKPVISLLQHKEEVG